MFLFNKIFKGDLFKMFLSSTKGQNIGINGIDNYTSSHSNEFGIKDPK